MPGFEAIGAAISEVAADVGAGAAAAAGAVGAGLGAVGDFVGTVAGLTAGDVASFAGIDLGSGIGADIAASAPLTSVASLGSGAADLAQGNILGGVGDIVGGIAGPAFNAATGVATDAAGNVLAAGTELPGGQIAGEVAGDTGDIFSQAAQGAGDVAGAPGTLGQVSQIGDLTGAITPLTAQNLAVDPNTGAVTDTATGATLPSYDPNLASALQGFQQGNELGINVFPGATAGTPEAAAGLSPAASLTPAADIPAAAPAPALPSSLAAPAAPTGVAPAPGAAGGAAGGASGAAAPFGSPGVSLPSSISGGGPGLGAGPGLGGGDVLPSAIGGGTSDTTPGLGGGDYQLGGAGAPTAGDAGTGALTPATNLGDTATGTGPTPPTDTRSFWDKLTTNAEKWATNPSNLLPLAVTGGSMLAQSLMAPSASAIPNLKTENTGSQQVATGEVTTAQQLNQLAAQIQQGVAPVQAQATTLSQGAQPLINAVSTGTVPPAIQTQIDQQLKDAQTAIRAKYAQMGMSGSTAETQDLNAAQASATALQGQVLQQISQLGLSEQASANQTQQVAQGTQAQAINATNSSLNALGMANQIYNLLAQQSLQSDQASQQAIANLAAALARSYGSTTPVVVTPTQAAA